jgi:hypothetical protein
MGAHKGKQYKDKPSKQRYWTQNHRRINKKRRILRCNGQAFLDRWVARYG